MQCFWARAPPDQLQGDRSPSYYGKETEGCGGHMKVEQAGKQKTTFIILNLIIPPISNLEPPHTRICFSVFMYIQRVYAKCTLCLAILEVPINTVNIWPIASQSLYTVSATACRQRTCCRNVVSKEAPFWRWMFSSFQDLEQDVAYHVPQITVWMACSAEGGETELVSELRSEFLILQFACK